MTTMTKDHAAALQAEWQKRVPPVPCEHGKQEMEHTATGYLTGTYYCVVCGEPVARK